MKKDEPLYNRWLQQALSIKSSIAIERLIRMRSTTHFSFFSTKIETASWKPTGIFFGAAARNAPMCPPSSSISAHS
jgi:hypothetical protein